MHFYVKGISRFEESCSNTSYIIKHIIVRDIYLHRLVTQHATLISCSVKLYNCESAVSNNFAHANMLVCVFLHSLFKFEPQELLIKEVKPQDLLIKEVEL